MYKLIIRINEMFGKVARQKSIQKIYIPKYQPKIVGTKEHDIHTTANEQSTATHSREGEAHKHNSEYRQQAAQECMLCLKSFT